MDLPDSLVEIIREAAVKYADDIDAAVDAAVAEWRASDDHDEWLDEMERLAMRSLIHDSRHKATTAWKRNNGMFGGPAKVGGTGAANAVASACILDAMLIDGQRLGDIRGERIPSLIQQQRNLSAGYNLNARILERFVPLVPKNKTIREAVTPAKAERITSDLRYGEHNVAADIKDASRKSRTKPLSAAGG